MDEVGDVILRGGPRDGVVLASQTLEDAITVSSEAGTHRYVRTGASQQLRAVTMAEPFRRFWIYEYVG